VHLYILYFKGGDILALEAISKIQEAEATAKDIIDKAVIASKEILSNAQDKAVKEYDHIITNASIEAKKMKDNALIQGKENSQPTILKGDADVEAIMNIPKEKIESAVSLVIGRIVKFNGNS